MRYRGLNNYLKDKFGEKVYKISLEIDVTCPNRDGRSGTGGCIYCNTRSNNPFSLQNPSAGVREQLLDGMNYVKRRHHAKIFIAYFQQHTNTYAPIDRLRTWFYEGVDHPEVIGLAVSTRPDCIDPEIAGLLDELNKKTFLWVELGLQSTNPSMLEYLNRGHTIDDFINAVKILHSKNISVCAHVILGLPGENDDEIIKTAQFVNNLNIEGIKIHNLHIIKDTVLESLYKDGQIKIISLEDYAKRVVLLLEHLNPEILIHRFNSHAPRDLTVSPEWSINKLATFNAVEKELELQDTWQGKKFK